MACFKPLTAWYGKGKTDAGKRVIVWQSKLAASPDDPIKLPCGQCIGCRLERSRQWAMRCLHESSLYDDNCFITLTYDDAHLPSDCSLHIEHFQKFMKRLRKRFGDGIRFFHCGEYGEKSRRPHYHACLFNFDFVDKTLWQVQNGNRLYRSADLEELWPFGFSLIGDVTFESAAYVARYILKKVNGDMAEEHYTVFDDVTGEVYSELKPEYITMSRRPGIGRTWIDAYIDDVYPRDYVIINGKKCRPPRYYDNVLALTRPYDLDEVKESRQLFGLSVSDNNTKERLAVREEIQYARLRQLIRPLN